MKKYFLFLNLFLMFFVGMIWEASAAKKYRYIKREHGIRFSGNIPINFGPGSFDLGVELDGAYLYNYKGMLEFGPYFHMDAGIVPFSFSSWGAGLLTEYNFIKNRGNRKLIPTIGIKIGADGSAGTSLLLGAYGALKIFVGKRTPFIVDLGYQLSTPMTQLFTSLNQGVNISMGFAYYFDFY